MRCSNIRHGGEDSCGSCQNSSLMDALIFVSHFSHLFPQLFPSPLIPPDQSTRPNWDSLGAQMNSIRTSKHLTSADIVVVRFGEKYRQWNAAFEAGYAAALGKQIITVHPPGISHMLKEVNASASCVCEDPEQVRMCEESKHPPCLSLFPTLFFSRYARCSLAGRADTRVYN